MHAQIFDSEDTSGDNNVWKYNRAPEGYVFELVEIVVSTTKTGTQDWSNGIVALFDGHEYTRWNIFPGVESSELLARIETSTQGMIASLSLHNWECKEYALATRSTNENKIYKCVVIIWYYLRKMNTLETLYYAVIQPKWKRFKKAFRKTVEPSEEEP